MKKHNIIVSILLLVVLFFSSCEKDLNIEKMGNLGAEQDFYKTDADADAAIACCYVDMGGLFDEIMSTSNLLSDDIWCGGGQKNDNSQREDIGAYTFGATNENIQSLFTNLYKLIYHSNLVIEKFETHDTAVKKRALAEAYFFRGFAHFYLGSFYGTAPVVNHLLGTNEYGQANSTQTELYAQAASDFKLAVESGNLSAKTNVSTNIARVTQEAAQAYLGKTYVFLKEWDKASTALNSVINSQKYKLYEGDYENLLHTTCDYSSENILEWNCVADYANFTTNLSFFYIYHGYRGEAYTWALKPEYSTLSNGGWGFYNPTASLYNAFVSEEGADGYRLSNSIKTYNQLKSTGISVLAGKVLHGHEGYWNWKFRLLSNDYIVFGLFPVVNARYMRYAEVLLLAAEANLQNGNTTKALECLNQVRVRAKLNAKTAITLNDIKIEKRLELFDEGCRWMDLVRWGDASSVLKDKGKSIMGFDSNTQSVVVEYTNTSSNGFVTGKHEYLPIPQTEVTLNNSIKQNPNW